MCWLVLQYLAGGSLEQVQGQSELQSETCLKKKKKRQEKPPYIAEIILGGFYLNKIIFKILFKGNVSYRYNIHMVEIAYGT